MGIRIVLIEDDYGDAELVNAYLEDEPDQGFTLVHAPLLEEGVAALNDGGADVVLLDNMDTPTLREAVAMTGGRLVLEASGNMRLDRIAEVAATGVNYISSGALTHSARTLDLGLDF